MPALAATAPITASIRLKSVARGSRNNPIPRTASAGILAPILTYWTSSKAGEAQGAQLGKQTAAASLGAAVGSAAGGLLYDVAWLPDASFLITAAVTGFGVALSLGLPRMLGRGRPGCASPGELNQPRRRSLK